MEEAKVVALHINGNMTLKSVAGLLTGVLFFSSVVAGSCLLDGVIYTKLWLYLDPSPSLLCELTLTVA